MQNLSAVLAEHIMYLEHLQHNSFECKGHHLRINSIKIIG